MLALVLAAALIAQGVHGAPTNCGELCEQSTGSYGQSWGSHSSYSKQSRYGSHQSYSSGSGSLGTTGARIEDLDENAVFGNAGLDRPGNWHDEKHYVTDDGKGEMNYRAGQTVSNNGYSKYASHSYRYGSHDSHAPLSNSQVLSTSQFNSELQNIRNRIASFMGNFNLGSSSLVNSNFLEEFKNKASLINNQLNDVCSQVDEGSSMYQQMQQEIQQFQRQVEERQRQIEATMYQTSSASSASSTHGSLYYPEMSPRPSPVVRPDNGMYVQQQQQRIEDEIGQVQSQISNFYSTFNRIDSDVKFQDDLNSQVNVLTQKLIDLAVQAEQNQSQRQRIENMKSQYEAYVSSIRDRIQEMVRRNQEEEIQRQQRLQQIENERLRLENEEKEKLLQLRLEEDRLRQQEQEAERQRLATEKKRQDEEAENRRRLQALEEEKIRIRNEELNAAQARRQSESLQLQLNQQQQQLNQLHNVQTIRPQMTGSVQVSGSSSVHHTMSGSYGSTGSSGTTGAAYTRPQQVVLQPHVDLTAAVNRLQQELNRVQSEVNKFNSYRMRLTASNSASIADEARQKYEQLRQNLENICETSNNYNNQNILNSAQELQRHFESLYQNFKHQAEAYTSGSSNSQGSMSGGYSSSSSYGSSASYQQVKQPKISNIEFTHEKSTEVEIGTSRRPAQHYSSGSGYSQSSGYRSYGAGADDNFRSGAIDLGGGGYSSDTDCVEQQAGQPCLSQARRYRRSVGDYGPFFDQQPDDSQKYVLPSLDYYQSIGRAELPRDHQPIRNSQYSQQRGSRVDDSTRQQENVDAYYSRGQQEYEDLNQQHVNRGQNEDLDSLQRPRSQDIDVLGHRTPERVQSVSAHQSGEFTLEKSRVNDNNNKSTEKSNLNIMTTPKTSQSQQESDVFTLQKSGFNDYLVSTTENPQQVRPIGNYGQSESQDFTLDNSEFYDGPKPLNSAKVQLNQQIEDLTEQQSSIASSSVQNQRLEKLNDVADSSLTQQAASQVDFGSDSQVGRAIFSQDILDKPERFVCDNCHKQNKSQGLQVGHRSEHPTGKNMENLSQQNQQRFDNAQGAGSDASSRYLETANSETDRNYTSAENQGHISTIRPIVRPAPKPRPRYSRPWQVNNINNIPKQTDNEQNSNGNQNASIEQSFTPKSVKPLRGDLPGQSEFTTSESTTPSFYENIPITSEKTHITPEPNDDFDLEQHQGQVQLNINSHWVQSNNRNYEIEQSGGAYRFNQHQNFNHNFSYTQNSKFDNANQQNININIDEIDQNPLSQRNNQFESHTNEYGQNQQSVYRYHEKQLSHSKIDLLESTSQNVFNQQTQFPSFEQSSQYEFDQQEKVNKNQRTEDLLASGVIPIDDKKPLNTWEDGTTPPTFWKKIGQKLTHTYDKAKEKAKNIFG